MFWLANDISSLLCTGRDAGTQVSYFYLSLSLSNRSPIWVSILYSTLRISQHLLFIHCAPAQSHVVLSDEDHGLLEDRIVATLALSGGGIPDVLLLIKETFCARWMCWKDHTGVTDRKIWLKVGRGMHAIGTSLKKTPVCSLSETKMLLLWYSLVLHMLCAEDDHNSAKHLADACFIFKHLPILLIVQSMRLTCTIKGFAVMRPQLLHKVQSRGELPTLDTILCLKGKTGLHSILLESFFL